MSEEILKALMQLFAIVSKPGSDASERRLMVESLLSRQLNQELVAVYLDIFDNFFKQVIEEDAKVTKKEWLLSRRSVRVLKICTSINEELAQPQKIIVLFQLLEFIKSETQKVTGQEMEFITTVSDTFNIPKDDFDLTYLFITHDLATAKYICDRIAIMYLGRIVEIGPVRDVFENPQHPYTRALLSAVPVPDPTRRRTEPLPAGEIPDPINPPGGCSFHPRCPLLPQLPVLP